MTDTPEKSPDGFYHATCEEDLIALVKLAAETGKEIRVRGSAHSVVEAVYTDPEKSADNPVNVETPPVGDNINVIFQNYRSIRLIDQERRLVEVDAGINLGIDPRDPTHTSTWENSLLYRLDNEFGWTLSGLGGISHQTVSGFLCTGSSGGSIPHSIHDNLYGFRIIDATGNIYTVTRDDDDPTGFEAAGVSMGLLGVISKVILQCAPMFNIVGQEAITTVDEADMSLFQDDPKDTRPSMGEFLQKVEYTRTLWWPQRGVERLVTWQAKAVEPVPGFRPVPYLEFTQYPNLGQPAASIIYITFGNAGNIGAARPELKRSFRALRNGLKDYFKSGFLKWVAAPLAWVLWALIQVLYYVIVLVFKPLIKKKLHTLFAWVMRNLQSLDTQKKGALKGTPQIFQELSWRGLPMDNAAKDLLMPTEFTEIWVPVGEATRALRLFRDYFNEPGSIEEAYGRTGYYGFELYGSKPNRFWLSPSYSDGEDIWKDGVLRFDIYWFVYNPGNPAQTFFPNFWKLLRDNDVPFRLHWGKFQPYLEEGDPDGWVAYFRSQYPHWDHFMALRAQADPKGIFLSNYWRRHLGIK